MDCDIAATTICGPENYNQTTTKRGDNCDFCGFYHSVSAAISGSYKRVRVSTSFRRPRLYPIELRTRAPRIKDPTWQASDDTVPRKDRQIKMLPREVHFGGRQQPERSTPSATDPYQTSLGGQRGKEPSRGGTVFIVGVRLHGHPPRCPCCIMDVPPVRPTTQEPGGRVDAVQVSGILPNSRQLKTQMRHRASPGVAGIGLWACLRARRYASSIVESSQAYSRVSGGILPA